MADYNSAYTGEQIDSAVGKSLTYIDALRGATSLGDFSGKTVADLQAALDEWIATVLGVLNSSALFRASSSWVAAWNSNNLSETIGAGTQWAVSSIAVSAAGSAWALLISSYYPERAAYIAYKNDGAWSKCFRIAVSSEHFSLTEAGTTIPAGSDLNDYTTPGNYYVSSGAIAENILNSPISSAGYRLVVSVGYTQDTRKIQIAITGQKIYLRFLTLTTWTAWWSIATSDDITSLQSQIDELKTQIAALNE